MAFDHDASMVKEEGKSTSTTGIFTYNRLISRTMFGWCKHFDYRNKGEALRLEFLHTSGSIMLKKHMLQSRFSHKRLGYRLLISAIYRSDVGTGHAVLNEAMSSENVGSGSVHNQGTKMGCHCHCVYCKGKDRE